MQDDCLALLVKNHPAICIFVLLSIFAWVLFFWLFCKKRPTQNNPQPDFEQETIVDEAFTNPYRD